MKTARKKGFTLIEIMLALSILGFLAALSIPAVLRAYTNAQTAAMERNIAEVEKAKGILTLPAIVGMAGAMGLTASDDFNDAAISNLCRALQISSLSELSVAGKSISVGTLTLKAYYE